MKILTNFEQVKRAVRQGINPIYIENKFHTYNTELFIFLGNADYGLNISRVSSRAEYRNPYIPTKSSTSKIISKFEEMLK